MDNQHSQTLVERAREAIRNNPEWYHSIELAPGVVTPGKAPLEVWQGTLRNLGLPTLQGKSVLDIGAYDGFFSFAVEQLGADRVVALDEHVWCTDMVGYTEEWKDARAADRVIPSVKTSRHWRPEELPGKRPFDAAREIFDSRVEPIVGDFMQIDSKRLGKFDVVLFLGILYHMEDPLAAMRRVSEFIAPGGFLGLETEAIDIPGAPDAPFLEFFPTNELNHDAANWWAPNIRGIEALTIAVGLEDFKVGQGPPKLPPAQAIRARFGRWRTRYRAVVSARSPR